MHEPINVIFHFHFLPVLRLQPPLPPDDPDDVDDEDEIDKHDDDHEDGEEPDAVASVHPAAGKLASICKRTYDLMLFSWFI